MTEMDLRPDIQAARNRMSNRLGSNREIKRLVHHLWEGEEVRRMVTGSYGQGIGLVVLTDRRVLFVKDGWIFKTSESFPLDKISSVQWTSSLIQGKIILFSGGNKAEIVSVPPVDGKTMVDQITEIINR